MALGTATSMGSKEPIPPRQKPGSVTSSTGGSVPLPGVHYVEGASALDEKARRKRSIGSFKRDVDEFRR